MATEPTDGELLMRFIRHRDEAAFETLVRRHKSSVYSVCYRVLGNAHDAEDAFQATFLVLARKAKRFQSAASIGGWLFRVALRTANNARAKKWRSKEEGLNVTVSSEPEPLAFIQEQELVTTLYEELGKLPEKYQTPIVLCLLEGKSRLEASVELECTVASLKARLARGRQQLRINLTRRGVAFSVALTAACSTACVSDAAFAPLCAKTTAVCASHVFASGGHSIAPEIVQLSEKGMSAMTLATYSKLAIASLVLLTIGLGSVTLPMLGPGNVHGADGVTDIALRPAKLAQRTTTPVTPPRQKVSGVQRHSASSHPVATLTMQAQPLAPVSDFTNYSAFASTESRPASRVSKEASNEVILALIEALEDTDQQVAQSAAKTLVSIGKGHSDAVEAFTRLIADVDSDKRLRYYAVAGLGRIGGKNPEAAQSLMRLLKRDSDPVFRKAAVEALGELQLTDEIARALASALKDSNAKVRSAVARVLSRLNPRHNSALAPRLSLPRELNSPAAMPALNVNVVPAEPSDL